jgi:hypothetical protein
MHDEEFLQSSLNNDNVHARESTQTLDMNVHDDGKIALDCGKKLVCPKWTLFEFTFIFPHFIYDNHFLMRWQISLARTELKSATSFTN